MSSAFLRLVETRIATVPPYPVLNAAYFEKRRRQEEENERCLRYAASRRALDNGRPSKAPAPPKVPK